MQIRGSTALLRLLAAGWLGAGAAHAGAAEAALPAGCTAAGMVAADAVPAVPAPVFPPVQLQVRTPLAPSVLPGGGRNYLVYELHLQNFSAAPLAVGAIAVYDADQPQAAPLAVFKDAALDARLRRVTLGDDAGAPGRLGVGQGVVAFLCLAFDAGAPVPAHLRHRVLLDGAAAVGPSIAVQTALPVLGRPLTGANWRADNTPSLHSHHRMGLWVADGEARIARRYAIDWKRTDSAGRSWAGDPRDVHAYHAYGAPVLAVGAGKVVVARDGMPDNIPKTEAGFTPAVPVTMDTVGGNQVIIELGDGQYASYFHLQPGSVAVKVGDAVRLGQPIARIGNSGDARWPHLHFQLTDRPDVMASEGLPHAFDAYRTQDEAGQWHVYRGAYPMGETRIDFGP